MGIIVDIRWMVNRDLSQVMEIETNGGENCLSLTDLTEMLRQRNHIGMVAEEQESKKIVAFMVYELCKDHFHLLNLTIHPEYRRQQIGYLMVQKLQNKLIAHRRVFIQMEVRETNLRAQLFLKQQGFHCTGIMQDWYQDQLVPDEWQYEDAYQFVYYMPGLEVDAQCNKNKEFVD